jgi:hypothetical protein
MGKNYKENSKEQRVLEDSLALGVVQDGLHAPVMDVSGEERVLAITMSVDEYFDVLISRVRKDYAAL